MDVFQATGDSPKQEFNDVFADPQSTYVHKLNILKEVKTLFVWKKISKTFATQGQQKQAKKYCCFYC